MSDPIYRVNPGTQMLSELQPVSLTSIGIRERNDLQQWIINHPELLGGNLLVLTSEFDRFENSRKRLDILALDMNGTLVIIELKLEAYRSYADLQALRYAAFCSTMTMDDCQRLLATFENVTNDEAAEKISEFLAIDELPELNNRPRIIIAAGSMDDQKLISCVIWLRNFGLDITCVELAPYREENTQEIVLGTRTIVPMPEARDFLISVERKETYQAQQFKGKSDNGLLWQKVAQEFNELGTGFRASGRSNMEYMQMGTEHPKIHYEWSVNRIVSRVHASLHFEDKDPQKNLEWAKFIEDRRDEIVRDIDLDFEIGQWGRKWTSAEFLIPFKSGQPATEVAKRAADAMGTLIERTYPIICEHIIKVEA